MDKKGFLKLEIEIDYDKMITDQNLEALYGFTGAKNPEDIARIHMANLGESLNNVIKDLPMIRYGMKGDLIPVQQVEEEYNVTDQVKIPYEQQAPHETVEEELNYTAILDGALEKVSIDMGVPQLIKINENMREGIEKQTGLLRKHESGGLIIHRYQGFPLVVEGMEEMFLIDYKPYSSNETLTYSSEVNA